jgi:AcrR family transcriptional regulator
VSISTTVEHITENAQVAKGKLYLYLKSKEDLRSTLGERYGQQHLAHILEAVEKRQKRLAGEACGLGRC